MSLYNGNVYNADPTASATAIALQFGPYNVPLKANGLGTDLTPGYIPILQANGQLALESPGALGSLNWAEVLVNGNTSGATDPYISAGQTIRFLTGIKISDNNAPDGTVDATCIGIGSGANANTGLNAIAIGNSASSTGTNNSLAIGNSSVSSNANTIAIGPGTSSSSVNTIAIGNNSCAATASSNIAFGNNAQATTGTSNIAIGTTSRATGTNNSLAIGFTATASANGAIAIGNNTFATGATSTTVGASATNGGAANTTAIGSSANNANFTTSTALGHSSTNTAASQIMLGTTSEFVQIPNRILYTTGIRIGGNNTATATTDATCIAIGSGAGATGGTNSLAIGLSSSANSTSGVALGWLASTGTAINCTALGAGASNSNFAACTSLGYGSINTAANQIMLGTALENVQIPNRIIYTLGISVGGNNTATGTVAATGIAIGSGAVANTGTNCLAAGVSSSSTGTGSIALGFSTTSSNTNGMAFGSGATSTGNGGIALGTTSSDGGFNNGTAIGSAATCTTANQIMLGTTSTAVVVAGSLTSNGKIYSHQATPPTIAAGANVSAASIFGNSSDVCGNLSITTSIGGIAFAASITYNSAYTGFLAYPVLFPTAPMGTVSAGLYISALTNAGFTIAGNFAASGTYTFNYHVIANN